jgi:hypothetical protein
MNMATNKNEIAFATTDGLIFVTISKDEEGYFRFTYSN